MDATARKLRARRAALARWSREDSVAGTATMRRAYRDQLVARAIAESDEPLSPQEAERRGYNLWLIHQNNASAKAREARLRRRAS